MRDEEPEETPVSVPAGTIVCGRYRAERRLGAGGMGEVYLVQHVHTDERFAMKVLLSTVISDRTALERFRREARTPARIDSEHVVRVTDADVARSDGVPFRSWSTSGRGPRPFIRAWPRSARRGDLRAAARALEKAHALGIMHRRPEARNIFINSGRRQPHIKTSTSASRS